MIIIPVEGYLSVSDSLGPSPASESAVAFYNMVRDSGQSIALISASRTKPEAELWCHREGVTNWHMLICREDSPDIWPDWKVFAVRRMVGLGNRVQMYVDSDIHTVTKVAGLGVQSMLHVDPFKVPGRIESIGTEEDPAYLPWDLLEQSILSKKDASAEIRSYTPVDE